MPRLCSDVAATPGLIAEQFLESTASQLTYHGLCELTAAVKEEELSVFFRNNHFSTMIKHKVWLCPGFAPCPAPLQQYLRGFLQDPGGSELGCLPFWWQG